MTQPDQTLYTGAFSAARCVIAMKKVKEAAHDVLALLQQEGVEASEGQAQAQQAAQAFLDEMLAETQAQMALSVHQGQLDAKAAAFRLRALDERWKGFAHRLIQAAPGVFEENLRQRFREAVQLDRTLDTLVVQAAFAAPKSAQQLKAEADAQAKIEKDRARDRKKNSKPRPQGRKAPTGPKSAPQVLVRKGGSAKPVANA